MKPRYRKVTPAMYHARWGCKIWSKVTQVALPNNYLQSDCYDEHGKHQVREIHLDWNIPNWKEESRNPNIFMRVDTYET